MIITQAQKDELVRRAQHQLGEAVANVRFAESIVAGEEIKLDAFAGISIVNDTSHRSPSRFRHNPHDKGIMSNTARERISRRMKKTWAKRRKAHTSGSTVSPSNRQRYNKKNPHWTQTPAGARLNKRILAKATKAAIKARKKKAKEVKALAKAA